MPSYASTQINLPTILAHLVSREATRIPQRDLVGKGWETIPHVTVCYGLLDDSPEPVRNALYGLDPFNIILGSLDCFEGAEGGTADVIYASVHPGTIKNGSVRDPGLLQCRARLERLPMAPDLAERAYIPHLTLAYVKPGLGKLWATKAPGGQPLSGMTLNVDAIMFSTKDREMHEITLGGAPLSRIRSTIDGYRQGVSIPTG